MGWVPLCQLLLICQLEWPFFLLSLLFFVARLLCIAAQRTPESGLFQFQNRAVMLRIQHKIYSVALQANNRETVFQGKGLFHSINQHLLGTGQGGPCESNQQDDRTRR